MFSERPNTRSIYIQIVRALHAVEQNEFFHAGEKNVDVDKDPDSRTGDQQTALHQKLERRFDHPAVLT